MTVVLYWTPVSAALRSTLEGAVRGVDSDYISEGVCWEGERREQGRKEREEREGKENEREYA